MFVGSALDWTLVAEDWLLSLVAELLNDACMLWLVRLNASWLLLLLLLLPFGGLFMCEKS